jgi:hypothetical protein
MRMTLPLALAALLSGCLSTSPATAKPDIPDDLRLVCHKGKIGAASDSAKQVLLWNIPCGDKEV